jgi:hypothetical protein
MARYVVVATLLSTTIFMNQDAWARGRRQARRSGGQGSAVSAPYYTPAPAQPPVNKIQVVNVLTPPQATPAQSVQPRQVVQLLPVAPAPTSSPGPPAGALPPGAAFVPLTAADAVQAAPSPTYGYLYPAANGTYTFVPSGTQAAVIPATIGQR